MYSTQTATDIEDIPALIRAFAADRGWTVNGDAITRPGGGIAWTISAEKQSFGYHIIRVYQDGLTGSAERHTFTCLPRLRGTSGNPQVLTPSKVHLFGNEDPFDGPDSEPFIVCVIECGYNHYRHVYIGGVVKFGDFTGGDCICMNFVNQYYWGGSPTNSWSSDWSKFMFSAKHSANNNSGSYAPPVGARAGGVTAGAGGAQGQQRELLVPTAHNRLRHAREDSRRPRRRASGPSWLQADQLSRERRPGVPRWWGFFSTW